MKFKKLILLAVAAAVLFGAAVMKQRSGGPPSLTLDMPSEQTAVGNRFETPGVARLDITRGKGDSEKVALTKDASGRWTLTNRYGTGARKDTVEALLNHLADVRGELRSDDAKLLNDYPIADGQGFHFEAFDAAGQKLAHRIVSPTRPRGTQNFVREAGSDKVIVTFTDILSDIGIFSDRDKLDHRIFADLRPAGIDASQVRSMEWTAPGRKKLTFVKKQDKDKPAEWSLAEEPSAQVDASQIQSFFAAIFNLYANETMDPKGREKDFQNPWLHLVSGSSDKPEIHEVRIGPKDAQKHTTLIRTFDGLVYEMPDAQLEPLLQKTKESFLKKA